jgi:hypothetical protein
MFFKQSDKSSGDSNSAFYQGGLKYLLHSLQWLKLIDFVIPSVTSIEDLRQLIQVFDSLGVIIIPHMQQRLN